MKLAFAILSYDQPQQLLRLVKTLNRLFDGPFIACHHNFHQCALDESLFPPNASFIRPHINTHWGHITTPRAALRALRHLADNHQPDWFFLLSGSDYPVRSAAEVFKDLSRANCDAFLQHTEFRLDASPGNQSSEWGRQTFDRYWPYYFLLPHLSARRLFSGSQALTRRPYRIQNEGLKRLLRLHARRPERIYRGGFWFQANKTAISALLDPRFEPLWRFYRNTQVPEEAAFHTALCSTPGLRISQDNKRYENWSNGGSHPKWLELTDVPSIAASGAHFARKFRPDGVLQDYIDKTILFAEKP